MQTVNLMKSPCSNDSASSIQRILCIFPAAGVELDGTWSQIVCESIYLNSDKQVNGERYCC